MSSRIVPLAALSLMLIVIFWAVVATAQEAGFAGPPPAQPQQLVGPPPAQPQQLVGPVAQPGVAVAQPPVQAPFQLSPGEEQALDRVLDDWQALSGRVKTLESDFTRWDFGGVFGNGNTANRIVKGKLRYAAPDKGYYALEDESEKWICTGAAVFEFRADVKRVSEHRLPPQLQGQAISDGPMPFVFGVEKAKMKHRYWLRIVTPATAQGEVWLEAYPKFAKDAANFEKVEVILKFTLNSDGSVADLQPHALNQHLPNGKDRRVYRFDTLNINGVGARLQNSILDSFVRPSIPSGWQHVVEDAAADETPAAQAAPPAAGVGNAAAPTTLR